MFVFVSEKSEVQLNAYKLRARLPQIIRYAAVAILALTVIAVIVGFYRERNKTGFRLKSEHTHVYFKRERLQQAQSFASQQAVQQMQQTTSNPWWIATKCPSSEVEH